MKCTAPRWARRRSRPRAPTLGWTHPPFEIPDAIYAALECARARRARRAGVGGALRALSRRAPGAGRRIHAPHARRAAGDLARDGQRVRGRAGGEGRDRRHAQGVAAGDRGVREDAARAPRRIRRPDGLRAHELVRQQVASPGIAPGNYIHFGVREFAMCAIANGMALHGGLIPYVGTFLTFSDYARNALRMAALMKLRVDLRVHPRLDRTGRGRTDAPVGRARGEPAPHSEHGCLAALRHRGDRRCLGRGHRARRRPRLPAVHAAERARSRRATARRSRRYAVAAMCWPTGVAAARSAQ